MLSETQTELPLRAARDDGDLTRVSALNIEVHGEELRSIVERLVESWPGMSRDDVALIEDPATGEVVATLCLIPWTIDLDGSAIPCGELGIVGTREPYRGRGLMRRLMRWFDSRLAERGCLISTIQGIPHFYRRFGYTYGIPLEGGPIVNPAELPPAPEGYTCRVATVDDVPTLVALYDAAMAELPIHTTRTADDWRFVLTGTAGTAMANELWLIEQAGRAVGYVRAPGWHFHAHLLLSETSALTYDAALAVLRHLLVVAAERGQPGVRLSLPESATLTRLARAFGAQDLGQYAWQVRLPDLGALFASLTPTFERRLAASPFAGWTGEVTLAWYRGAARLTISAGRVTVAPAEPGEDAVQLDPDAWPALVLGLQDLTQLRATWPDLSVAPAQRLLMETLFPRREGRWYSGL